MNQIYTCLKEKFCYTKEEMRIGSSQVHVVMWISVMENQEVDVITFFYERGKSKADYSRRESAHNVIPEYVGLSKLKRIFTEVFLSGETESFILWTYFENFS